MACMTAPVLSRAIAENSVIEERQISLLTTLGNDLGEVVTGVNNILVPLQVAIGEVSTNPEGLVAVLNETIPDLVQVIATTVENITGIALPSIDPTDLSAFEGFLNNLESLGGVFVTLHNTLGTVFVLLNLATGQNIEGLLSALLSALSDLLDALQSLVVNTEAPGGTSLNSIINNVLGFVQSAINASLTVLSTAVNEIGSGQT